MDSRRRLNIGFKKELEVWLEGKEKPNRKMLLTVYQRYLGQTGGDAFTEAMLLGDKQLRLYNQIANNCMQNG
ncbi:unnamed protein product [Nippostrongylus brasiliensis]|uniref:Transposase n=1 Tax=Nippostrongylus brasiliensis TaxID=27835 RepID=A0A0N4YD57_NIPBR|nr:unnamed protein product [Nippostrongylus brasiliensis]